jgi:F0F1-type ATP synthase delta subunit
MKASWYAEALYGALQGKSEKEAKGIVARFLKTMQTRGHTGLLKHVPAELEKVAARHGEHTDVTLVVSGEKGSDKWVHAYDHYKKEGLFPADALRKDMIDKTLIGGFQIRTKNLLIDGSYKRSLIELYKNIVNTK